MILVLLTGCYGDLSNRIFVEDAKFLAALPSTEAFAFDRCCSCKSSQLNQSQVQILEKD